MELLKKNIHMSRRKAYGENRMTLSEDFNIPDKKPDAAGLIQKRGEVKLEEVRTTEGQVQHPPAFRPLDAPVSFFV